MDFKWEMQERIDAGMNPDDAYYATRDSYVSTWDNRDKFDCNSRCDCTCTCDSDCECKNPEGEAVPFGDAPHRRWRH